MCNWINIKWNECDLVIVIVMNDLESTSISMVEQWSVQLSGGSGSSGGGGVGSARVVAAVVAMSSGSFFFFVFLLSHV